MSSPAPTKTCTYFGPYWLRRRLIHQLYRHPNDTFSPRNTHKPETTTAARYQRVET
ncbi:hypothetical protein PHJA_000546300 [Phtheirospermum japonicum]|uniref:Uncharacterized protein n=1 Tax=Phtheirospermum japonicum TaxID=374723 RepID=A0A830BAC7_9LAMI|nr:hypothetical protein PHJA_000546300 [Phtheirospermum japonicum]